MMCMKLSLVPGRAEESFFVCLVAKKQIYFYFKNIWMKKEIIKIKYEGKLRKCENSAKNSLWFKFT